MDGLQQAIQLNNEGARLMRTKRTAEALPAFERALTIMKGVTLQSATTIDEAATFPQGSKLEHLQLGDRIGWESDICHVFDRTLELPEDPKLESLRGLESFQHWTCMAIMFNYSLACHHYGIMHGFERCLDKAAYLYKLAIKMVHSSERNGVMYAVVECAALSNVAHIHYHQCSFEKCDFFVDDLYNRLSATTCLGSYLSEEEIEGLFMNTVYLHAPVGAQAA